MKGLSSTQKQQAKRLYLFADDISVSGKGMRQVVLLTKERGSSVRNAWLLEVTTSKRVTSKKEWQ